MKGVKNVKTGLNFVEIIYISAILMQNKSQVLAPKAFKTKLSEKRPLWNIYQDWKNSKSKWV